MGTRGTLRVYLDGELKIRQYNQWDSYPTGQFAAIRDFMSSDENVALLAGKLACSRFYTKEEHERFDGLWDGKDLRDVGGYEFRRLINYINLTNRDYGADILHAVAGMCRMFVDEDGKLESKYLIPDWAHVFEEDELENQEGNYTVEINTGGTHPSFVLYGEWHGVRRVFPSGYLPDDDELQEWEDIGYGRGSE